MSPSHPLQQFLAGMEYPATKDDLIREAEREGLDADDVHGLRSLGEHCYSARRQVLSALRLLPDRMPVAA